MNLADINNLEAPAVSGVTLDRDVAKISFLGLPFDTTIVSGLFGAIAEAGVNVDIIVHNLPEPGSKTMQLGFTTSRGESGKAIQAARKFWDGKNPGKILDITAEDHVAKVSVVGVGMRSHPGVAATTFASLSEAGIDIRMISTSEIKISCVIDATAADEACKVLHRAFIS
jgi:aspartate kinase